MSAPNLSISVEPVQNGKATYLPLVAPTSNDTPKGKIVLRLDIKNNGTSPVTITGIAYGFPGSQVAPVMMQGVDQFFSAYYKDSGGPVLSPGQSKTWTNGLINLVPDDPNSQVNNAIFLPEPIPSNIEARVSCAGFSQPATVALSLVPHKSTTPQGSYFFPYHADDLRFAEYYVGSAVHWANGGASGTQIFAHDFGCEGYDTVKQTWSRILPGKSGSANPDYRIYGKPIHALADGTVLAWHDGMDENAVLRQFPKPTPSPLTGNSVTILYSEEKVTCCHLQKGSMPASLQKVGAPVKAGQVIGLVGNTGNSSEPHTHVEAELNSSSSPLRPLPFHDAYALSENAFHPPDPQGPWSKLTGRGLSKEKVAVWPGPTPPAWYPPGWGEVTQFGVPEASYQTIFNRATSSGYRPVWLDGYEVQGKTFFNVIFHPQSNVGWLARHGMSPAEYQTQFDAATKDGYRLTNLTTYVSGGSVTYAAIFDKIGGPAWRAYHGVNAQEHQQRFDEWTKGGFVPVNVSITAVAGTAQFAAFYLQQDVGSFVHLGGLTSDDYQKAWDTNVSAGRQLAYLSAYQQGGGMRFSAIFQQKTPGSGGTLGRHNLTGPHLQTEYDKQLASGLLTRVLVGYEVNGAALYAAAWRKA
jgi:murein DD-endopeptidase MepM/ murein hydrolase activator NlpD